MSKLDEALKLIKEHYTNLTDENDPYTGGVLPPKTNGRFRRIIDMLQHEVDQL